MKKLNILPIENIQGEAENYCNQSCVKIFIEEINSISVPIVLYGREIVGWGPKK